MGWAGVPTVSAPGSITVTNPWKATAALALVLGLAYSTPAFSQTQVGVNFANGGRLSQSAQLSVLSELQTAGAKVIRIRLEPRTWGRRGDYEDTVAILHAPATSA